MEYKNKNHAYIDTAESRDAFDSRIRSGKKESDYEKQKKFSAALEKENSTKEQKKSEYIKATEERKQQEKRLKMYQSFLEDDVATYRATGDTAALERINKTKTTLGKVESSFLKAAERNKTAATEYDAAIGRFNRVLGKFQTARAAWEGSARTDRASIQGELERLKQERKEKQKQYTESAEIVRAYERALPKGQKIGEWANIAGARKGTRNLSMENSRDIAAHRYLLKESLGKEVRDLDARIEELEAELRFSYVAPYINKGDFEAGSAYKSTKNGKKVITQPVYTTINPGDPNFGTIKVGDRIIESGFQDLLYDYINKDPDAVNVQRMGDGGVVSYHGVDKSFLETMTGDEIAIFNYIYRESPEKAYGFIKTLEGDLQLRETIKKREEWKKYGKENKIIASVGDVLLAGEKAKTGAMNALNYIGTGEIDENAGYNDLIRASGAIREGVSQDMGKVGTFIYNTSMSLADNVARLALSGGSAGVAQSIMFGGVFADTVVSAKDRGLSDKQAFALGVATAGIEALTEKMPLDAILDGKTLKESAKRYILKGAISEAGEELTSNALSTWADVIISKDKSEWKQSIAAYEAQGFGAKEALGRAFRDQALSAGVDSLAGLLSGAAMSGGVAIANELYGVHQDRKTTKETVDFIEKRKQRETNAAEGRQYAFVGTTADGMEVYETSEAIKKLPYKERRQEFKRIMAEEYRGRTAKFTKNGKTYYARFDSADVNKNIYGDKKSDSAGRDAKINVGADGNIFELVENAAFKGEQKEKGKTSKAHKEASNWMYFVKEAQIDNKVFDVVANVRETANGEYVYDIQLNENNKAPASPHVPAYNRRGRNGYTQSGAPTDASPNNIPQSEQKNNPSAQNTQKSFYSSGAELPTAKTKGDRFLPTAAEMARQNKAKNAKTETERSGILHGVDDDTIRFAENMGKKTGRKILFYEGGDEEGYYDRNTGEVYVNTKNSRGTRWAIAHEVTHSLEGTKAYNSLLYRVARKLRLDGTDMAAEIEKIQTRYKNHEIELGRGAAAVEVVANYVANNLMTDALAIAEMTRTDPETAGKIRSFLDSMAATFGSKNTKERIFAERARSLYAQALNETRNTETGKNTETQETRTPRTTEDGKKETRHDTKGSHADAAAKEESRNEEISESERRTAEHREEARVAREDINKAYERGEITEAEYDEAMNVTDEEMSMAGESMLYDDGRQYAIEKEKGVAKHIQNNYNNTNGEAGGVNDGREVGNDNLWRRSESANSGEQHTKGDESGRGTEEHGKEAGLGVHGGRSGENLHIKDNEGREISAENAEKLRDTAITDEDGNPLATYHFTADMNFRTFAKGDTGFHFGNEAQARKRGEQLGKKQGRLFRAYLNVKNPIRARLDINAWVPSHTGLYLWSEGFLTDAEWNEVRALPGKDYNSEASVKLREILETKGYDGIIYPNFVEGEGDSYLVFRDEQIIKTDIKDIEVQEFNSAESGDRQYAIEKDGERGNAETSSENTRADNLPKKAQAALRQTENRLSERIGEILGVPKQAQREFLKNIIREISEGYLQSGTVDRTKADALFEEAYKQGVVIDAEYFEQYKHVRDHLRNTKITIAEEDRSSIADFNAFRKSTLGKLRIVNEGGIPVDVVYMELEEMAPELFPTEITHPGDQLQHMYEIADGIRVSEQTLEEAYGEEADTFKEMARDEFHEALNGAVSDFKRVKRYSEDRERMAAEKKAEEDSRLKSTEDVKEAYKNLKAARRDAEKIKRRVLLTEEDEMRVGQLLRGEISPMSLDPETDNVKDILAVYNAKKKYEEYAKQIRAWNAARKEALSERAKSFLKNIHNWKDKQRFGGLRYSMETMERIFRDIMGEDAEAMIAEYITPVHKAQAESTKLKNEMRDRVRALGLSRKAADGNLVSEAHAVQLLGEAEDNIAVLKAMPKGKERDGKTLSEWEGTVAKLWAENPKLDEVKIRKAVQEFRDIYDFLFEQMNEVRVRNGYEPVNYRRGYFPHFQPGDEGVLAQFGRILGIDTSVSALPTTINGMTHIFRPGIQWLGNAQERLGFNTVYDAVEGFDKYIEGVADVIYQTDNIQKLRALAKEIRYAASDEGIRKQVDAVEKREDLSREEKDALNAKLFEEGKFSLGNFVVELDEYTNLLANKKSREDREMERKLGREFYNVARRINSNVAANMTALNIPSWLTNFIPLTQAWGLTDTRHLLRGMRDTLKNVKEEDDIVARSVFLTTRRDSDPIVQMWEQGEEAKTWFGKMGRGYQAAVDKLSGGMELIDNFTSEAIVRAKYYQNLKEGMSEQAAMEDADAFAAGVMADRSKGAMPTAFYQTNPMKKLFTQFQIEVNNQYRYVFKDVPYALKNKGVMALAMALTKIVVGAFLYNELYELIFGRRAATDILGILNDTAGDFTGYNLPSLLDIARGEADFKEEDPSAWKGVSNLVKNVGEEMPFVGGVVFGGGRVPLSSALPDAQNLGKAIFNGDWSGKKRFATFGKEILKPVYYGVLPGGGGQIKKVVEGADAVIRGGSYTTDTEGKDVLQYPVYNDGRDMPVTAARAMLFGKSTLPTAKDWVDGGFKSLSAKDTEAYQAMLETGAKGEDAFAAVQAVRKAEKSNDKRDAIRISGLSDEAKKVLYRTKISDTRDDEIAELERKGISFDDFLRIHNEYTTINTQYEGEGAANKKAMAFSRWVNSQPWTKTQKDAVRDAFAYFSQIPAEAGKYDAFMDAGLTDEKAAKVAEALRALKPEKGKDKVSDLQRYRTVATATLTDKEKMAALSTMMGESEYKKLDIGSRHGVTPIMYVTFKEKLLEYDEDANGTFKQEEVTKAIRAMTGSGINLPKHDGSSFNLTNKQRAALWQMANSSWKPNKNPFDTSVGTQVYNALKKNKKK